MSPAVLSVKATNPDAVVLGTDNTQTALGPQAGGEPGLERCSSVTLGREHRYDGAVAAAGDAANGLYGAAVAALPSGSSPEMEKFRTALKASSPSTTPDLYSLIAYGTNQVLFEVLKKLGNDLSWENFLKVTENLKNYKTGLLPPITFGPLPNGHTGAHGVMIDQYNSGTWTAKTDFLTKK